MEKLYERKRQLVSFENVENGYF